MSPVTDTQINSQVRRVLVQNWIDLGRLALRTTRGVVYLKGTIAKLRQAGGEISYEELDTMLLAIKQINGVRRVQVELPGDGASSDATDEPPRESGAGAEAEPAPASFRASRSVAPAPPALF